MLAVALLLLLAPAHAAAELTDEEVDMVACPFVAATIKRKFLLPVDGQWTRDQCEDNFNYYMDAVFGDGFFTDMAQGAAASGICSGFFTGDVSPMPWTSVDLLHATHTGIRLANITDQPDTWKSPCDKAELGAWSTDPSCGEPGPHPEVFDRYAELLSKGPDDTWSGSDLRSLCTEADELMYTEGNAHPPGGVGTFMGSAGCNGVYTAAHSVFGDITTVEWKAFLMNLTFPASYVPPATSNGTLVATASAASRPRAPSGLLPLLLLGAAALAHAGYH